MNAKQSRRQFDFTLLLMGVGIVVGAFWLYTKYKSKATSESQES
jgi:hypothetical protein